LLFPDEAVTEFENKVSTLACKSTEPDPRAVASVEGEIVLSPLTPNEADEIGSAPPVAMVRFVAADASNARSKERDSGNTKVFNVIPLVHDIRVTDATYLLVRWKICGVDSEAMPQSPAVAG
jgi:hypothetical protein